MTGSDDDVENMSAFVAKRLQCLRGECGKFDWRWRRDCGGNFV